MTLRLPAAQRRIVESEARLSYPKECCGVLVGEVLDGVVQVRRVVAAPNVSTAGALRYRIDERLLLETHRSARGEGLEVVGYYHSHPDGPAVPSRLDRQRAHPRLSYLIAEVRRGNVRELSSWRLPEASEPGGPGEEFQEESIESTE